MRNKRFNEVRQLRTSSGQKGREILLINQLQDTIHGENTPLYIVRESLKKNQQILNRTRNEDKNMLGNCPDPTSIDRAVERALCSVIMMLCAVD